MFSGFVLAIGTLVSLTYAGVGFGTEEVAIASSVTVFKSATILGTWSIMVPNIGFWTLGAKSLMMMDFAFFSNMSGMEVVQWILFMTFGLGLMWGFFSAVIGVIQGLFRRV